MTCDFHVARREWCSSFFILWRIFARDWWFNEKWVWIWDSALCPIYAPAYNESKRFNITKYGTFFAIERKMIFRLNAKIFTFDLSCVFLLVLKTFNLIGDRWPIHASLCTWGSAQNVTYLNAQSMELDLFLIDLQFTRNTYKSSVLEVSPNYNTYVVISKIDVRCRPLN